MIDELLKHGKTIGTVEEEESGALIYKLNSKFDKIKEQATKSLTGNNTGKLKVTNFNVYDFEKSILASGYPKNLSKDESKRNAFNRANKLGSAKQGSGHDNFLSGILVSFDVEASQVWWMQFMRYHFAQIVSSESKMHMIQNMDISKKCSKNVSKPIVEHMKNLITIYNIVDSDNSKIIGYYEAINKLTGLKPINRHELFQIIVDSVPMGLMLKARISTNYLQLKTIVNQRKYHKYEQWNDFIDWVFTLPEFESLTGLERY